MWAWANWWALGWIAATILYLVLAGQCDSALESSEGCSGLSRFAFDNEALALLPFAIALLGIPVLHRLQVQAASRPCPRCGSRVPNGEIDCAACGFDFDSLYAQRTHRE